MAVLGWNATTVTDGAMPDQIEETVELNERTWTMFAPEPKLTDTWYVVPGQLATGETVNAFRGGAVTWDRPPDGGATYPSFRWRKYFDGLRTTDDERRLAGFTSYLCRDWNANHETRLVSLTVYVVEQPTRLDGPEPTERVKLYDHACWAPG